MSVITKETMDKKMYNGLRIAFAGCMASGKSFAAASLKKHIGNASIMSFSNAIKRMARGNIDFDNRKGYQLVGHVGRQVDPEAWVNILTKEILQMPQVKYHCGRHSLRERDDSIACNGICDCLHEHTMAYPFKENSTVARG